MDVSEPIARARRRTRRPAVCKASAHVCSRRASRRADLPARLRTTTARAQIKLCLPLRRAAGEIRTAPPRVRGALEAPDDEMTARQGLEMFGEGEIDRRAADRADHRHGLGGEFLPGDEAKAGGDLGDQPGDRAARLRRRRPVRRENARFRRPSGRARRAPRNSRPRSPLRRVRRRARRPRGRRAPLPAARCPRLLHARSGRSSASGSRSRPATRPRSRPSRKLRRSPPKPPPRPCGRHGRPWRARRGRSFSARRRGRP